jgi:hypothetical protein
VILALISAVTLTVAIIAPTIATIPENFTDVVSYGSHGEVILQLPTAIPSHPACIRFVANDLNNKSTYGSSDSLIVALWFPSYNGFIPVAMITDATSEGVNVIKQVWNNTPVWMPPLLLNVINVSSNVLEVWCEKDVIIANLTVPQRIVLPFDQMNGTIYQPFGNQTFTLPALTLTFRPIAHGFDYEEIAPLPRPPFSGWTVAINSWQAPAWVQAKIPAWLRGAQFEATGHICTNLIEKFTPPAA